MWPNHYSSFMTHHTHGQNKTRCLMAVTWKCIFRKETWNVYHVAFPFISKKVLLMMMGMWARRCHWDAGVGHGSPSIWQASSSPSAQAWSCDKVPQTGRLRATGMDCTPFWRPEVGNQDVGGVGLPLILCLLVTTVFHLCVPVSVSKCPLCIRTPILPD